MSVLGLSGSAGTEEFEVTGVFEEEEVEVRVEDAAEGAVEERSQGLGGDTGMLLTVLGEREKEMGDKSKRSGN